MFPAKTKSRTTAMSLAIGATAEASENAVDEPIVHVCNLALSLQAKTTLPNCSNLHVPLPL